MAEASSGPEQAIVPRLQVELGTVSLGKHVVLRDIRLACPRGSHTAILGPNGAGKTTLLRAIVGLLEGEGVVQVDGEPISSLPPLQRARCIAYVPQRSELQARLTVREVVAQGRYAHQTPWLSTKEAPTTRPVSARAQKEEQAVDEALRMTDTAQLQDRPYPELSGGEQRRVLLARALASEAPVIALDEPTAALDLAHVLLLFEQLAALTRAGRSIITVLHSLHEAAQWCDQAVVLSGGRIVYSGGPDLPAEVVREVYGVEIVPGGAPAYRLIEAASGAGRRGRES